MTRAVWLAIIGLGTLIVIVAGAYYAGAAGGAGGAVLGGAALRVVQRRTQRWTQERLERAAEQEARDLETGPTDGALDAMEARLRKARRTPHLLTLALTVALVHAPALALGQTATATAGFAARELRIWNMAVGWERQYMDSQTALENRTGERDLVRADLEACREKPSGNLQWFLVGGGVGAVVATTLALVFTLSL